MSISNLGDQGRRATRERASAGGGTSVLQFVYTSHSTGRQTAESIDRLLKHCAANNPKYGITGFLLFDGEYYLQLIEGNPVRVDALYERIRNDKRHEAPQALIRQTVRDRAFSNWSMAYLAVENNGVAHFVGTMSAAAALRLSDELSYGDSVLRQTIADYLRDIATHVSQQGG